jgi:hypothetical protein
MAIDSVAITASEAAPKAPLQAFNDSSGPSFSDVLDILNPLQHIPIINTIYQHLTGDTEGAVADVAGGTLWAGPIGLVGSLIDLAVKAESGKSIGDTVLGWLGIDDNDNTTQLAENSNPGNPASTAAPSVQQTAQLAMPAALPQVASTAAAKPRSLLRDDQTKDDDKDAPQQIGDFLVFGAAGSNQPMALTPALAQQRQGTEGNSGQPGRQGDYLVFGGSANVPPAPGQNIVTASATPPATARQANTQGGNFMIFGAGQPAAATPQPLATPTIALESKPAAPAMPINATPARSFAAPQRHNPTIPATLPPPTTGPAALPGHGPSQAITTPADESWFVNAVKVGLTKYQAAQQLTGTNQGGSDLAESATLH